MTDIEIQKAAEEIFKDSEYPVSNTYCFIKEHNRLHIAAMAMQGILSNADRMKGYEYVATEPPCEELAVVVARNALRYADALIAAVKEGGSHD